MYVRVCMLSPSVVSDPMDYSPLDSPASGIFPDKITGVGCHSLLQGIFLTQGSNPCLPYCRQILYLLSHYIYFFTIFSSVQFSRSVMSNSL